MVREYLSFEDRELKDVLAESADQVDDTQTGIGSLAPKLKRIISRLNVLADQDQTGKVKFISVGDRIPLPSKEQEVVAVSPNTEEWTKKAVASMLSLEGRARHLTMIVGSNFMDNDPISNDHGERLVFLPVSKKSK